MLAGGTVSNCFDLTPHDETSSSILQTTWTGIRIHGMDLSKYFFESERYFGIKNQGMNPKRHLFGKKGETLSTL